MKIYRDGTYVKNIPAKFKPISDRFEVQVNTKRLSVLERRYLEVELTRYKIKEWLESEPKSAQIDFAINSSDSCQIRDVVKVKRRDSVEYRITFFDGVTIRVPYSVFCEYPKKFREERSEF